jgi:hypothetical protein
METRGTFLSLALGGLALAALSSPETKRKPACCSQRVWIAFREGSALRCLRPTKASF